MIFTVIVTDVIVAVVLSRSGLLFKVWPAPFFHRVRSLTFIKALTTYEMY